VRVPKLVGLKTGEARALARQAGFEMQEIERSDTPDYPDDVIFQQDPLPDSLLRKTSVIRVRVSDGAPPVPLPPLTNTDPQAAKAALEAAGFKVEIANEGSLNIPKGVVTRTDPPADTPVKPGRTVKLFVSLGEASDVPDLKGMTLEVAQQVLASKGLTIGAVTDVGRGDVGDDIDSVPVGTVYNQDPTRGTLVSKGSSINVRLRRSE
jgi:serine/threonine-protein kinase